MAQWIRDRLKPVQAPQHAERTEGRQWQSLLAHHQHHCRCPSRNATSAYMTCASQERGMWTVFGSVPQALPPSGRITTHSGSPSTRPIRDPSREIRSSRHLASTWATHDTHFSDRSSPRHPYGRLCLFPQHERRQAAKAAASTTATHRQVSLHPVARVPGGTGE